MGSDLEEIKPGLSLTPHIALHSPLTAGWGENEECRRLWSHHEIVKGPDVYILYILCTVGPC